MNSRQIVRLSIVGASAACGLVVEIVAGRMVAPYLGMSLYTWTAIIAVVLAGFSVGHWIGGLLAEREPRRAMRAIAWSLLLAAATTVTSLIAIRWFAPAIINSGLGTVPTVLLLTTLLFFLPSLFVGVPSPVLTKLAIDGETPERSGRTIGAYYAVGALGSIAGTLAAGFIFIGWLGITWTLLLVALAYLVMAITLFWDAHTTGDNYWRRPVLFGLAALVFVAPVGLTTRAFEEPCKIGSNYYCIRVADVSREFSEPARALILDHLGHGINLRDQPQKLVSPYVELQDLLARIHVGRRSPFRAFFVGGGAYTLPRAWLAARPDTQAIVAEVDPAVTVTAERELWLKRSTRLKVMHVDARVALEALAPSTFDVIVGDAFHDIVIPPHLVTREFFRLVASRLQKDGIYLMNVVDNRDKPRLAFSIQKTLAESFENVEVWRASDTGTRTTFVLAAVKKTTPYAVLESRVSLGVRFSRLADGELKSQEAMLRPFILTDDFAPVDRLIEIE